LSAGEIKQVLGPLHVGEEYIAAQWKDSIILLSGPAMTVWRVSLTEGVQFSYAVPGASLKYYYDAVVGQNGVIYLFATRQEGTFDFAQVHTVDTEGRTQMQPFNTYPDQYYGFPPLRKQCALAVWKDRLYIAGGEYQDPQRGGQTIRLDDFWYLNLQTFVWQKVQVQLPYRMIEPRMSALDDGQCYLWSDCDNPNGCYSRDKHIHVVHLWLGAPSLQEQAWRRTCELNPYILTANVDYLRQYYRLPEKFLWRVYMAQLGPPTQQQQPYPPGYQPPPPAYQPPGYQQTPPGYQPHPQQQQPQPAAAWGTAPGVQHDGGHH